MKIINFKRNYGNTFRSLDKIRAKLSVLERSYIQPPSIEFVCSLMVDQYPHSSREDIVQTFGHRIWMRRYRPDKFKPEYVRGEKYHLDSMEELDPFKMDNIERELLQKQRIRRARIGYITSSGFDENNRLLIEVDSDHELPASASEYLKLFAAENLNS